MAERLQDASLSGRLVARLVGPVRRFGPELDGRDDAERPRPAEEGLQRVVAAGGHRAGQEERAEGGVRGGASAHEVPSQAGQFLELGAELVPPLVNDVGLVDRQIAEQPVTSRRVDGARKRGADEALGRSENYPLIPSPYPLANAPITLGRRPVRAPYVRRRVAHVVREGTLLVDGEGRDGDDDDGQAVFVQEAG